MKRQGGATFVLSSERRGAGQRAATKGQTDESAGLREGTIGGGVESHPECSYQTIRKLTGSTQRAGKEEGVCIAAPSTGAAQRMLECGLVTCEGRI